MGATRSRDDEKRLTQVPATSLGGSPHPDGRYRKAACRWVVALALVAVPHHDLRDLADRVSHRAQAPYWRAAFIIARATGAARPLPLTSERAASDCSTITATATCLSPDVA